jgi:hypothetical protein
MGKFNEDGGKDVGVGSGWASRWVILGCKCCG